MRLRSPDLIGASLVALFTLGVAFSGLINSSEIGGFPTWFLPFGILMVLVIPGYVLTLATLPQLDRATILLLSLGISISMDVMGGFVLHITPWKLHPVSWAVWLSSITLLGCIIAAYRRSRLPKTDTTLSALPEWNWKMVVSLALTSIFLVAAILIASNSALQSRSTFTQLWALPSMDDDGFAIHIGIRNFELSTKQYDLYVESRGLTINKWTEIGVAPGESWIISMPLLEKPQYPITILLYEVDAPGEVYRMVHLAPVSFDGVLPSPVGQ